MTKRSIALCCALLLVCPSANAWFFFLPIGAISRAMEKDPDTIKVSAKDREIGRCAAYHVNQANNKKATSPEFHEEMATKTVATATDKDAVKDLAGAYSDRWNRAAAVDINTNRAFGQGLSSACRALGIPLTVAQQQLMEREAAEMKAKADAEQLEAAQKAADEAKAAAAMAPPVAPAVALPSPPVAGSAIDFNSEAKKSAKILGCNAADLKVVGIEARNILYTAACEGGAVLALSCDPAGLCLKK